MENKQLDTKIDYSHMTEARTKVLQTQLNKQLQTRDLGKQYSLRRAVLKMVVEGNYQEGSEALDNFLESKRVYPAFYGRAEAHATHAKELINAVRAKRNFPNLSALSMSKQQEILDHAVEHFDELRLTLKTIEHLLKDEAVKDIRSTVWVVRTLVYVVVAIVASAFVTEFSGALGQPLWVVFNEFADKSYGLLAKMIPFL